MALLCLFLLLAPGIYLLAPLGALLAVGRPRRLLEWVWLAACALWCGAVLARAGGPADQVVRASGVLLAAAFILLALRTPLSAFSRATLAAALTVVAIIAWLLLLHIPWSTVEADVAKTLTAAFQAQARDMEQAPGGSNAEAVKLLRQMATNAGSLASIYPAVLILSALGGQLLASAWHRRLATTPIGVAPGPFAEFRFSDHAVWLVILGLAGVLAPLPPGWHTAGANLLIVAGALYLARGAAIVRASVADVPGPVLLAGAAVALFLFTFVAGGLTLLGLADTWVDFRHRRNPANGDR